MKNMGEADALKLVEHCGSIWADQHFVIASN